MGRVFTPWKLPSKSGLLCPLESWLLNIYQSTTGRMSPTRWKRRSCVSNGPWQQHSWALWSSNTRVLKTCTAKRRPCTLHVPVGVTLHSSPWKALRNPQKETCLISFNLEQCFSDFSVYKIHKGIFFFFKFWSVVGPSFCIFMKLPSNADTADLKPTIRKATIQNPSTYWIMGIVIKNYIAAGR